MTTDWSRLQSIAAAEIRTTLQSLPRSLRERALKLPVICEPHPNDALVADGIEPDTLGLFVGPSFQDEEATAFPVPAQIILFLENLWESAAPDEQTFREEIRTTLLHELGHYLGLNEDELFDRGLE